MIRRPFYFVRLIIGRRIKKFFLFLTGRGDFSRPNFGRLKPPLPQMSEPKTSSVTFTKLNNEWIIEVNGFRMML
jgi:hypothetical protein